MRVQVLSHFTARFLAPFNNSKPFDVGRSKNLLSLKFSVISYPKIITKNNYYDSTFISDILYSTFRSLDEVKDPSGYYQMQLPSALPPSYHQAAPQGHYYPPDPQNVHPDTVTPFTNRPPSNNVCELYRFLSFSRSK